LISQWIFFSRPLFLKTWLIDIYKRKNSLGARSCGNKGQAGCRRFNKPGWQTVVNTNDCSMGITLFILHSEARLAAISQMFITNHSCLNFRIHRQSTMPIHPATL